MQGNAQELHTMVGRFYVDVQVCPFCGHFTHPLAVHILSRKHYRHLCGILGEGPIWRSQHWETFPLLLPGYFMRFNHIDGTIELRRQAPVAPRLAPVEEAD